MMIWQKIYFVDIHHTHPLVRIVTKFDVFEWIFYEDINILWVIFCCVCTMYMYIGGSGISIEWAEFKRISVKLNLSFIEMSWAMTKFNNNKRNKCQWIQLICNVRKRAWKSFVKAESYRKVFYPQLWCIWNRFYNMK